ncbi:MAG: cardiolipin synthase [Candidatus Limivicinus sp.]|jgi:cardiolipin synthase
MNQDKEHAGLSLLKKGQKGLFAAIFSRFGLFLLLLLIQAGLLAAAFIWFEDFLPHIYGGTIIFTLGMVIYLLNTSIDPTGKITWLVIIMLMPVFGALLFLYTQEEVGHRKLKKLANQRIEETRDKIPQSEETAEALKKENPGVAGLHNYVARSGCYPIYGNSQVTYFPLGDDKFRELLIQLENAKDFIFMEYFIVVEGEMWGQVLEILARKAAQGVDVRVMYDGTNGIFNLPPSYPKMLGDLGIKCRMFAPLAPFISTHYNYRDHRKILVIDGHTAFTGGVNLADEYINRKERFGHWKDTAVMVKGDAVRSFTLMFLQMWSIKDKEKVDYEKYLNYPTLPPENCSGYVLPYGDCPLDNYKVGEHVYIDMLNRAERYVHIMTPYLILDGEMEDALKFAAERGVDVRLILPGIPDKKVPFALAWTHYSSLLASGIKIYEYTPGFVHAKNFVSDDREAVVGTINLDYRSLYHHFECAAYMYKTDCVADIEKDFLETQAKCRVITPEAVKNEKFSRKAKGVLVKVIAPML